MSSSPINAIRQKFSDLSWPEFVDFNNDSDNDADVAILSLRIKPNIRWFEGHFPGQPVLPGVVQTHWAIELAKHVFSISQAFQKISNLKFHSMILPDTQLVLELTYKAENSQAAFKYYNDQQQYSEGKIIFNNAS